MKKEWSVPRISEIGVNMTETNYICKNGSAEDCMTPMLQVCGEPEVCKK